MDLSCSSRSNSNADSGHGSLDEDSSAVVISMAADEIALKEEATGNGCVKKGGGSLLVAKKLSLLL